ncbi:MAG: signal recognition particle receptor subunit alpha, partial [Acidimicrobiia bacterium]
MDTTTIVVVIAVAVIVAVAVVTLVLRGRAASPVSPGKSPTPGAGWGQGSLGASLRQVLGSGVGEQTWADLEEAMLAADVGIDASAAIVRSVRSARPENADQAREQLA